jgi:hypothetical protein
MPEFDPDKYLQETEEFDPDSYLASKPEPIAPETSAVLGAGQGITLGFGDEIVGAGGAAVDWVSGKDGSFGDNYRRRQKEIEAYLTEAEKQNPKSYTAGNIGGGIATMAVPGLNMLAPVKGASAAGNIARLATAGGLAGAGSSSNTIGSYKDAQGLAVDTAKGAAIGATTGGLFEGAGKVFGKYLNPEELRRFANEKAVKAAGATGPDMTKLGTENIQKAGKQLLNRRIVTPMAGLEKIAERSEALKETSGEAIGSAIKKIDDNVNDVVRTVGELELSPEQLKAVSAELGVAPVPRQQWWKTDKTEITKAIKERFQFNNEKVAQRIEDELITPNIDNYMIDKDIGKLKTLVEKMRSTGIKPLEFGQRVKKTQGKQVNFNSDDIPAGFQQDIYGILASELDDSVQKTGDLMKIARGGTQEGAEATNKAALEGYKSAKGDYWASDKALEFAEKGLGRERGNRQFSLTDYLTGIAGTSVGGPAALPTGAALSAGNKFARKYGASLQATGANRLADIIDNSPKTLKPLFGTATAISNSGKAAVGTEKSLQEMEDYLRQRRK